MLAQLTMSIEVVLDGPSALSRVTLFCYRFIFPNDLYVIVFTWMLLNASPLPVDAVNRCVRHVTNSPTCYVKKRKSQRTKISDFQLPTIMAIK
jgi:hypothetical protein